MNVEIKVFADRITFDDLRLLEQAGQTTADGKPAVSFAQITDLLERCVDGGVAKLPLTLFPDIVAAMRKSIESVFLAPPGSALGNSV